MKIKLCFPAEAIAHIEAQGLRQRNPETLRWTDKHPASHYRAGVVLRGNSGDILSGNAFSQLHTLFGAWIEVDSEDTKRLISNAMALGVAGLIDQIKVLSEP